MRGDCSHKSQSFVVYIVSWTRWFVAAELERQNIISPSLENVIINKEWAHKSEKTLKHALSFYQHALINQN